MKKFTASSIISLVFIFGLGAFNYFYREKVDGYIAIGLGAALLLHEIFRKKREL